MLAAGEEKEENSIFAAVATSGHHLSSFLLQTLLLGHSGILFFKCGHGSHGVDGCYRGVEKNGVKSHESRCITDSDLVSSS